MNTGLVIGGVVILIIVVFVILYFTVPSIKRMFMSEDDTCKPMSDEKIDNGDEYILNEDKECVIDECESGYELVSGECLSITRAGKTCVPSTTNTIDKGTSYEFDSTGACFASMCEDGYNLNTNVCEIDTNYIDMEYFRGGYIDVDLNKSNAFVVFASDYSNYSSRGRDINNEEVLLSSIYDSNDIFIYDFEDVSGTLKLVHPYNADFTGQYSPITEIEWTGANPRGVSSFNNFTLEPADIEGHDDIYYLKTGDVNKTFTNDNGDEIDFFRAIDIADRPSKKYLSLNTEETHFIYKDSKTDADLFRLKTRDTGLSLPSTVTIDSGLNTKNYLVRVVEETDTTS